MRPDDEWLRDGLAQAAEGAGALGFTADQVVGKVHHPPSADSRHRRCDRGRRGRAGRQWNAQSADGGRHGAGTSGTPTVSERSKVYMCGQRLVLPDETASRGGLTMAISGVRRGAGDTGPDITVTFTATTVPHP